MISIKREGIILKSSNLDFENDGVMNPAIIAEGENVHMFYRAVRKGNYSTIGYCRLKGPLEVVQRNDHPLVCSEFDYESHGMEDPRIVKIEETYYMTYTAYDGVSAVGALAISTDLNHFSKKGIITSQFTYEQFKELVIVNGHHTDKYFRSYNRRESKTNDGKTVYITDKDLVFFPRKIGGKFYLMHRIKPDIQLIVVDKEEDLTAEFWKNYFLDFTSHIFFEPKYDHESSYIGAGCPPIETPEGWLMIYHSVRDTTDGYVYTASAALLDLENPTIELARLPYPLFSPETDYELTGVVNRVCFPTGTATFGDTLYIYYGAADKYIACVSVSLQALINELITYKQ
ncbi:pesticidal protein Cry7Aa [uncultured Bacteroides sp.]|uniref:glycoside hydrolase family 130 protein n=1 Tax=uncultured Bacteroides sp. TaxID=162156 RepID=UPI002AA85613|nr:pesticidal protein Cry7Aa [uncultured Bacteroides sp.]